MKNIKVEEYRGEEFLGFGVLAACQSCGNELDDPKYRIDIEAYAPNGDDAKIVLCKNCLQELYEKIGKALHKQVNQGDVVFELVLCNDGVWRICPMIVEQICEFGSIRWVKGKDPQLWNIYAESEQGTYMYKNFYELGTSWFLSMPEALAALNKKTAEKSMK